MQGPCRVALLSDHQSVQHARVAAPYIQHVWSKPDGTAADSEPEQIAKPHQVLLGQSLLTTAIDCEISIQKASDLHLVWLDAPDELAEAVAQCVVHKAL